LNLFKTYESREKYEAETGKPCPPWDPSRPPKYWEDPAAQKSIVVAGVPFAIYSRVYVGFDQQQQVPLFDSLGISVEDAKTVNIPPTGTGNTNVPGADVPAVPCPVRALRDDEVIRLGMGAIPMLYTSVELQGVDTGFTMADRELLRKIGAKLGV
jgi:hypothetical protein